MFLMRFDALKCVFEACVFIFYSALQHLTYDDITSINFIGVEYPKGLSIQMYANMYDPLFHF